MSKEKASRNTQTFKVFLWMLLDTLFNRVFSEDLSHWKYTNVMLTGILLGSPREQQFLLGNSDTKMNSWHWRGHSAVQLTKTGEKKNQLWNNYIHCKQKGTKGREGNSKTRQHLHHSTAGCSEPGISWPEQTLHMHWVGFAEDLCPGASSGIQREQWSKP